MIKSYLCYRIDFWGWRYSKFDSNKVYFISILVLYSLELLQMGMKILKCQEESRSKYKQLPKDKMQINMNIQKNFHPLFLQLLIFSHLFNFLWNSYYIHIRTSAHVTTWFYLCSVPLILTILSQLKFMYFLLICPQIH